ncbi:hypothetical protein GUITHDRAFT_158162 [Guillardia theta CCMP2712]|uniref:Tubulin--tyrosine ligase-like protein 9 n=1 Tax=Guillardia theta (strain CCMP2712) TaxID=905079 RepID=L1J165_GUITC|nr:hypothetical protein GUITHDRAFT_158162 [Guillardia theta CCMP2712]EKX42067.1 hypothetical protein GUITHDRAFT_158162 [Guillardia theta CCMP2712]|eukprot:XP_005829047.1 hypothetical protein GUITHDRAFT_158162 [Guillardia theta CCMP2712]
MWRQNQPKKSEIKFKSLLSNTIHEVCTKRPGWKETDRDDWDFIWADKDWIRMHFDEMRSQLSNTARVNHFRNHYELTRKDHMVKNFKRMISSLRREDRASEAAQYDFFPVTYLLPQDYGVFVEDFKRQSDRPIWIAKPTGKAQGRGIFLFTELKDRYITNPYLVGGKKFDLRIYVLVTSYMPLTVWLYRSGFARFSGFRYNGARNQLKDTHLHLTNVAVQKTAPGYDREAGCKWLIDCLKRYMVSVHGQDAINQLFYEIQSLIIRSLQAVQKVIMNDKHCFELYGYDIMLDDTLKPWLLEVNASPSLTADTASDHELKCGMLDDLLDVIDLEERRTGDEIQVGGFDLIFNGSVDRGTSSLPSSI